MWLTVDTKDAHEMTRVNSLLLDNFVSALKIAQIQPKGFMLQTGAKNYGVSSGIQRKWWAC